MCCQPDGTLDAVLSSTATLSSILAALCGLEQPKEPDAEIRERLADSILLLVRDLSDPLQAVCRSQAPGAAIWTDYLV